MGDQLAELKDADRSIFSTYHTIKALRDSRYQNTAYAIAELIDNSIQARAEQIHLLCMEQSQIVTSRSSRQVSKVAILDNGEGMGAKTLLEALKFGGGTRHTSKRRIGKYGMGLPTSSVSQCKRVDVWTWQDGLTSMWHSSIDADDIAKGNDNVPIPNRDTPIPDVWKTAGSKEIFDSPSGTLVMWSNLDKIQWKTGQAIIDNTALEVGRIHRYFIHEDSIRIRAASFLDIRPNEFDYEVTVVANDPLYLMTPSSVPGEPWNSEPMFDKSGEAVYYPINLNGLDDTITVQYSIVKPEALKTDYATQNPGASPHGRHARRNTGVSVVREGREIKLEGAFLREGGGDENPRNRWWGCEVYFSRNCDELFGVDHNKQMVANFTQAATILARDDRRTSTILEEKGIKEDIIYRIVGDIRDRTRGMLREITQMYTLRRDISKPGGKRSPDRKAAETATDADREAIASGTEVPTDTDKDREQKSPEEREAGLKDHFVQTGHLDQDAQNLAKMLIQQDLSYQFNSRQLDGSQIFNVRSSQGVLLINLNTEHPIYELLRHIEDCIDENGDESDPAFQAIVAIRLLLSSWARMEDQTESKEERKQIQNIAINWGRQVDKVISRLVESDV